MTHVATNTLLASYSWNWAKRWSASLKLRQWAPALIGKTGGGQNAFDIRQLAYLGYGATKIDDIPAGSGAFVGSVAFNGQCYWGGAVNYVLWGRANKLCHDWLATDSVFSIRWHASKYTLEEALKTARVWKHWTWHDYGLGEKQAEAFTRYGYDGTLPPTSIALATSWSGQTLPAMRFGWKWLPFKLPD